MINFDDWFKELISNYVWYNPASMQHKEETFRKVANQVYMQYVASESFPPIQEARRHVYNKLVLIPGDRPKDKPWYKIEEQKKEVEKVKEWVPVSWEKRAEYLKQVQAEIDKVADRKIRPLLAGEAELKGQYDPPKPSATCAPAAPVEVVVEHINKVNTARRKYFLERNPDASEEEITAYLRKFDVV